MFPKVLKKIAEPNAHGKVVPEPKGDEETKGGGKGGTEQARVKATVAAAPIRSTQV